MNFNLKKVLFLVPIIILSSCNEVTNTSNNSTKLDLPEMPTLVDNRSNDKKMKTITTLNGNEVTYNANTRDIVALGCAGDILSLGLNSSLDFPTIIP